MPGIEILTIGTELLLGFTLDTNASELGRALSAVGVPVTRRASVGDDPASIRSAVSEALARTGAVLMTGGLGPTSDDVTKKVVAELYGWPLDFVPEIWESLVARFARFGRKPAERNRSQAEVPRGAQVLPNQWGTAPGLWLEGPPGLAILLPGVPSEMRNLLRHEVLPRLTARAAGNVVRSRAIRTFGIPESALADRLGPIEHEIAPLSLAYLPGPSGVDVRLTAWNLAPAEADRALIAGLELLRQRAGEAVYGKDEEDLAALVLDQCRKTGLHIATAESCTGGGIGVRLTAIPGSSEVYVGGVVAYDDRIKRDQLGVSESLITAHGAVSEPVAQAMAEGVARRFATEVSMAVTGIAGPGGGTAEKPVGLVYVASWIRGTSVVRRFVFPGDREEVRYRAGQAALAQVHHRL